MIKNYKYQNPFAEKTNYITDRRIIIGSNIMEYDIKQANINILKAYGSISDFEYETLKIADKMTREIMIGRKIQIENLKHNKSLIEENRSQGIKIAKDFLITKNNIKESEIVRIANDAVYVERQIPLQFTTFDILNNQNYIEFTLRNQFSSFLKLGRVFIFMKINSDEDFFVDVKGISDDLLELHHPFLGFICDILFYLERSDINTTISYFNKFYEDYINMKLDIGYYREFNSDSGFRIRAANKYYAGLFLDKKYKDKIDIEYNLLMLREIYSIILSLNR